MINPTSSFPRSIISTVLLFFTLLRPYNARNYYSNLDLTTQTLTPAVTGFKITGKAATDNFAYSVSTAGDIDQDGYDDIIIGAFTKDSSRGTAYVIYGGEESSMSNIDLSLTPWRQNKSILISSIFGLE